MKPKRISREDWIAIYRALVNKAVNLAEDTKNNLGSATIFSITTYPCAFGINPPEKLRLFSCLLVQDGCMEIATIYLAINDGKYYLTTHKIGSCPWKEALVMTAEERRNNLAKQIEEVLAFSQTAPSISELRDKVDPAGNKSGFTRLVKSRFIVTEGLVYLPDSSVPTTAKTESAANFYRKMAKALDRMAQQIDALEKEVIRLRNNGSAPVLSERAKRALAVYGD